MKNILLYLKKTNGDGGYSNPRICVPRGLQKTVMQRAHLGHRGINETMKKLSVRAYFPNMQEKITIMINNCVSCFQKFNQLSSTKGMQQHRELLGYPMQWIYLDTVGPLTPSKYEGRTCRHILTMLDGMKDCPWMWFSQMNTCRNTKTGPNMYQNFPVNLKTFI